MASSWRLAALSPTLLTQGARWDINTGSIAESKLKELHPAMPVMLVKAVTQDISVCSIILLNIMTFIPSG